MQSTLDSADTDTDTDTDKDAQADTDTDTNTDTDTDTDTDMDTDTDTCFKRSQIQTKYCRQSKCAAKKELTGSLQKSD